MTHPTRIYISIMLLCGGPLINQTTSMWSINMLIERACLCGQISSLKKKKKKKRKFSFFFGGGLAFDSAWRGKKKSKTERFGSKKA